MNSLLTTIVNFLDHYGSTSLLSLIIFSIIFGVFAAWLYGKTTHQGMIKKSKNRIGASILEGALYLDSPGVLLKSQVGLFFEAIRYLAITSTGLLALFIPVVLALSFASGLFGSMPLANNSSTLLTIETNSPKELFLISIKTPPSVKASPLVKDLKASKAYSRLDITECPTSPIIVSVDNSETPFSLKCDHGIFIQPVVVESGMTSLLYPGSISDNKSSLKSVTLEYPTRNSTIHWLITFSLVSLVAGFCGAKLFKIQL